LYHADYNIAIDLLPFGQIEENDTMDFNKRNSDLHIIGFKEVLEEAVPVQIEESIAQIPPLHGMVILKLIAWSDRPEERDNDLQDILLIIKKYFEIEFDEIVSDHLDVFCKDEFDQLKISSRVLGRKAAAILNKSKRVKERVMNVLKENNLSGKSSIAKKWAMDNDWTVEYAAHLLSEFCKGVEEGIK
jgi:predicted nucleotidyltransferase